MLETIYIVRHGFRMAWHGNQIGLSPTGRPRDPVLTAHGIDQVELLAAHFADMPEHERPQLIVSSPYYRCVQTSGPTAKALDLDIHLEPGVSEWFPPTTQGSGHHPLPMRASTISRYAPRIASASQWPPLVHPRRRGETIREIHMRARKTLELIQARCEELGVQRVLVVSHAATIIAMGRALLEAEGQETTDWETGSGIEIGAGTASLSVYRRGSGAQWEQERNGWAGYLPQGVEREWTFKAIPGNVEEPGMGGDYIDEEALEEAEMLRLELAGSEAEAGSSEVASDAQQTSARPRF
ncbi:unnamed protein product [Parajaminaea phylloscopi]